VKTDTIASLPPVSVAGISFFGYPVADWVQCLAGLWLLVQFGWWLYKNFIEKDKE
jgi:hypothetical protein